MCVSTSSHIFRFFLSPFSWDKVLRRRLTLTFKLFSVRNLDVIINLQAYPDKIVRLFTLNVRLVKIKMEAAHKKFLIDYKLYPLKAKQLSSIYLFLKKFPLTSIYVILGLYLIWCSNISFYEKVIRP